MDPKDNQNLPEESQRAGDNVSGAKDSEIEETAQKPDEPFTVRKSLSSPRQAQLAKKRRTMLMMALVLLCGAIPTGAYVYRDHLRGTRLGQLIGLKEPANAKEVYYCPMHPDYKSDKPGDCPICNMRLVKLEPTAAGAAQAERTDASWRPPSGERKILYWQDPMHPQYKSDKPGKAPDCGMDMVPVYADETPPGAGLPPGTVQISPQKQQLIGVQYGEAIQGPLWKTLRTVGKLTYDETKLARINPKIEGWIEKVYADFTGQWVKKGEPLISIYSPELVSTQQEFLIAGKAKNYLGDSPFREISSNALSLYDAARERLRLWDISEAQINELERRGTPTKTLTLNSPMSGFVLTRNAFEKQRITPETELYTIADLSTIWVLADIYEYEAPLIKVGQTATMSLAYSPGKVYRGKVTYIYPQVDNTTRTLKVRLEVPNRDFQLKPDMFVNVELNINYGRQISVPQEAVLDSGNQQVVFVAHDGGTFEPRKVRLGLKVDNRYVVLSGLKPGEKIVTSGNFLIDSESQLKSALSGMQGMSHAAGDSAPSSGGSQNNPPPNPPADRSGHRP
jgi:multidrug efflux pump subunit AcrA (membrane-fusion protein)